MSERGIVVFGADVWASDWLPMAPETELQLVLARIVQAGRGIVLLHDTKTQTAAMLPALLRELKKPRLSHRSRRRGEPLNSPLKINRVDNMVNTTFGSLLKTMT